MTRNALNGVLAGFLTSFASRNSDYRGYWLFGFLVAGKQPLLLDLRLEGDAGASPEGFAATLATATFADQLHKSCLPPSTVREASLAVEWSPDELVERLAGGHLRRGFDVTFRATAIADTGRRFQRELVVFVAPHDPRMEYQSTRGPVDVRRG